MFRNLKRAILFSVFTLSVATASLAGTVKLAWDYEGTGHKGFRLYYGRTSQAMVQAPMNPTGAAPYDATVDIADPGARTYELELADGTWYVRMITIGGSGHSDFTAEEVTVPVGLRPPTGLRIEGIMLMLTPTGGN